MGGAGAWPDDIYQEGICNRGAASIASYSDEVPCSFGRLHCARQFSLRQEVPGARAESLRLLSPILSRPSSLPPPDEGSVFLPSDWTAKSTLSSEGQARLAEDEVAEYPRAKGSP